MGKRLRNISNDTQFITIQRPAPTVFIYYKYAVTLGYVLLSDEEYSWISNPVPISPHIWTVEEDNSIPNIPPPAPPTPPVALTSDDIAEGTINKYFTDDRARAAAVGNSITAGVTNKAPSEDAVYHALALKVDKASLGIPNGVATLGPDGLVPLSELPPLGGGGGGSIIYDILPITVTILGGQVLWTELLVLRYSSITYRAAQIWYTIRDNVDGGTRTGFIWAVNNAAGTSAGLIDHYTETADLQVVWEAAMAGANVTIRYMSGANDKTMKAEVRLYK